MYLQEVYIQNFRSISSIVIKPCGNFNVLIGKNNSGKSNLLSSLEAFFNYASPDIVTLTPRLGDQIDFFQRDTSIPLTVTCVFSLSDHDRRHLVEEIGTERPQLKNALDNLDPNLNVAITIQIHPDPNRYACVKNVGLVRPGSEPSEENQHILFSASQDATDAIFNIRRETARATSDRDALESIRNVFDANDFQNVRRAIRDGGGPPADFFWRRYGATAPRPATVNELTRAVSCAPF